MDTTSNSPDSFNERSLFPIVTADILLSPSQHKKIIKDIRKTVDISDEHFNTLYQQLINNFVEFVQLLPTATKGDEVTEVKKAQPGGLINEGLLRALFALQLQKDEADEYQPDLLPAYTLFSTALLFDIGSVTNNRTVIISKEDGTYVKEWLPHKGVMQKPVDSYYRVRHGGGITSALSRHTTPLLARQIMPLAGFNWIAQDANAFDSWIALLSNEKADLYQLNPYLDRANKKILDVTPQNLPPIPTNIKIIVPEETSLGEDFLDWLKKGITNTTIRINTYDSDIHVIENGLFLEIQPLLKKFCAQSQKNPEREQVFEQLKKLGFIDLSETNDGLANYKYTTPFLQQVGLNPQQQKATNKIPVKNEDPKQKPWESITKYKIRTGIKVSMSCFLFFANFLKLHLPIEESFIPEVFTKEKIKKKLKLLKKLKLRRQKLDRLDKEIKEALLEQMKAALKR